MFRRLRNLWKLSEYEPIQKFEDGRFSKEISLVKISGETMKFKFKPATIIPEDKPDEFAPEDETKTD